ncbi:MAG TPA: hypothetical protein VHG93_28180 [Longimicrobium sp.]|nr:hypothetical protein [Longimicrobium sp.]
MDVTVITYAVYLAISIALTVWVARTLFTNGQRFLVDVFGGDQELAVSVNHLLVVGFYLINFAFVCLMLRMNTEVITARGSVESLAQKVGTVLLILGGMHFFNLYVFARMRGWRASRTAGAA